MIQEAIRQAVEQNDLTTAMAHEIMHEMMSGAATQSQIASFITAMRVKGETEEELLGFVTAMREDGATISAPKDAVDLCGTGGDGSGTFNISTISSFVVAAAGVPVAKHGNRAVSSRSGSADLLGALGIPFDLEPAAVEKCLETTGLGFMFAPTFHKSMRNVLAPRREIGIRTFFNTLGPLVNPAGVKHQLIGVYDPDIALCIARVLRGLRTSRALVVNGEGMDELTNTGKTSVVELIDDEIREYEVSPDMFGINYAEPEDIRGGTPTENARTALSILKGEDSPRTDVVALNSAAALYVSGRSPSLYDGLEMAREAILSGKALAKLKEFSAFANRLEQEWQLGRDVSELSNRRIAPDVLRQRCPELCRGLVRQISDLAGGPRALEHIDSDLLAIPNVLSVLALNRVRRVLSDGLTKTDLANQADVSLSDAISSSPGVSVVAEFKPTHPSAPLLHLSPDPSRAAEIYSSSEVVGVSVLVEPDFFGGSPELFSMFRSKLSLPLLFKDFVVTETQIAQAKRLGADAVLLIAKTLREEHMETLIRCCASDRIEPLVELRDIADLRKLSSCGSADMVRLIGINRRDLRTLEVKRDGLLELRELVRSDKIVIAESGIGSPREILALEGFDAVLIGSMFMQAENLEKTVSEVTALGRSMKT